MIDYDVGEFSKTIGAIGGGERHHQWRQDIYVNKCEKQWRFCSLFYVLLK